MGNPIKHSKSPAIHTMFAARTGESVHYEALLVEPGDFRQAVDRFFLGGGRGLNITLPFKQEAWQLADRLTERARLAGAVNTLWKDDEGLLWGDTTDGVGLVRDLICNHEQSITGKQVLILGAGGAVRGIIAPLLEQGPAHITIANRTESRALALAELFDLSGTVAACGFAEVVGPFDLIINGTSASLQGECPALPDSVLHANTVVYDMMYSAHNTVFIQWAKDRGCIGIYDGLGMLVEQAAESFSIWRKIRPETIGVVAKIRSGLI